MTVQNITLQRVKPQRTCLEKGANGATEVFYLQNGIFRFNSRWIQRGFGKIECRY